MLLPEWSTAVLFCLVIVVHESLVYPEQLNFLLFFRKILQLPQIIWFSSIFCVFEPFPTLTVWFWDPSFHSEDNWGTHMQLLQKIQTLTDAPEEKGLIKSQGVKTCWIWRSGWILLNLYSGKHVTIFCSFWRAVLYEKIWYLGKTRKIYTSSFCSNVFPPRLLMLLIYTFNSLQTTIECL